MDKAKKKTIKRIISWVALVALVATLAVMPLIARQEQEANGPVASILEATAQTGQIGTTLRGGGILEAGKAMEVNLPSGVKIKEFLVKNGELVSEGTPVAIVDRVSVMNAIVAVEDTLDYLQQEIVKAEDDTVTGTIKATAGGTVKQVFAEKGDSVQEVMLSHGALAVLSLDGRMAAALDRDTDLAAGDTVAVTLADGSEVDGRVESNLNDHLIVTVEDDAYTVGQKVTIATEDGDTLGTAELYIHNAWRATAYSGTVNTVYAKVNTEVHDGATLLTLKDTDFEGTMQKLANLHREYEELLQDLFVMYDTEVLTAPCDGLVSGVDKDSPFLLAAIAGEEGWFVDLLDNRTNGAEKSWTVVKLTDPSNGTEGCTGDEDCPVTGTHKEDCVKNKCTKGANCPANADKHNNCLSQCKSATTAGGCTNSVHKTDCISNCKSSKVIGGCPNGATGPHKKDCIDGCISSDGTEACNSDIHKSTCIKSCTTGSSTKNCPATKHHNPNCIKLCTQQEDCNANTHYDTCLSHCTEDENCQAKCHTDDCEMAKLTYQGIVSWVQQVGTDGLIVRQDPSTVYQFTMGSTGIQLIYPSSLNTATLVKEATIKLGNSAQFRAGDVIIQWTGYNDEGEKVKSGISVYTNIPVSAPFDPSQLQDQMKTEMEKLMEEMMGEMMNGLMGSLNFGNFASYGMYAGAGQPTGPQLFDLKGNALMTVTEQDVMTLSIAIDEHDIAKVALGQTAEVAVTALKGDVFEAQVTEIGNFGTNNGGSSKFSVELTMDADDRMLAGMNATAEIPLFTKMDVVTIPVAALVETAQGTVVYTALDPKTGEPASPVAVQIGVSDGENVEVISGIEPGQKVYYSFYNAQEIDHTAKNEYSFR